MADNVADIAGRLTDAQAWAICAIGRGDGQTPSLLGQAMMERPGATKGRKLQYKSQGYGRMGGAMMARLARKELVTLSWGVGANWHPTRPRLTPLGLAVRAYLENSREQ